MKTEDSNKLIAVFDGVKLTDRNGESAVFMIEGSHIAEYFRCTKYNTYHENPLTYAWTDSISNSKHINADIRQVATLKQKTEVVEDLLLGDGFSFHYEKGVIIIKDDKNETIEILFNNEVKELKSWINKIEL